MITMILPLAVGNALHLFLAPPAGATHWRVLRKGIPDISLNDPDAYVAYEGDIPAFIDAHYLINEVPAFYQAFYFMGNGVWEKSNLVSGTPVSTYEDYSTDVIHLLRERLEVGLANEVKRNPMFGGVQLIQVLTAPPSLQNDLLFPLVTLTLENESPVERFIGEMGDEEYFDEKANEWVEVTGWLADVNVTITGWCLNPDERVALRNALRTVLIANFPVLAGQGVLLPSLTLNDSDAVSGEYDAPLYLVNGDFSCQAPARVGLRAAASVVDVLAEVNQS